MSADYELVRSRRRTVGIYVNGDGRVTVRAPLGLSRISVDAIVAGKADWIAKKRAVIRQSVLELPPLELREGGSVPYLGEKYVISLRDEAHIRLDGGCLIMPRDAGAEELRRWLRAEALALVTSRTALYAERMGVGYSAVKVSEARGRWGSCSGKNSLNFAWRLILCPLSSVDYVVVHELSHVLHKDHGPAFWAQVAQTLPDYRARRDWLKQNRRVMELL